MRRRVALVVGLTMGLAACPGPSKSSETTVKGSKGEPGETHPVPKSIEQVFASRCGEGLSRARRALPALLATGGKRTVQNTLEPYNQLLIDLQESQTTAGLMQAVHPNEKIRDAARACEQEVEKFISSLRLNRKLYDAFAAVDTKGLDPETRRFVAHTLRDFRRAGVDRDEATRKRLAEIEAELTRLGQQFSKNITEDVRRIELTSTDQMAGLPGDYIKSHQPGPDGKIAITTNYPDSRPFLKYARSDELRKKLYVASRARGGEKNERVLRKILALRHEKATTLGFASWADYITADKMIGSGRNARDFIGRVVKVASKRSARDYAELLAQLRKERPRAKQVQDWQKIYLENLVKKERYGFDGQMVRPYLPYAQVQKGLLDITSKIYGIRYQRIPDAQVWHSSVQVFDVIQNGKAIGRIYLDMHPRDGKYTHAAQFTKRTGVLGKQLPEGVLVCNFPDPAKGGPALMEHSEVVTMFHEFGHLMHHIFGGHKRWIEQSGVATEWDFVEAPSQMFEEWAWSHQTLATFAKHHETGAVIPKSMVERMRRADKFGIGVFTLQQMFYAAISLEFHSVDPKNLDMMAKLKQLQAKLTPFPYVEGTRFYANFGHLNGYSAIYYTYMWSLVIAKDLLTPFEKHGLMNTEWTYRYRDKVLVPGGSKDAAELVADFLGRKYSFAAFEKYLSE